MFAIGSTPGFDDGALGSFHGSRRVTQFVQWAAPPAPELPVGSIVGGVWAASRCSWSSSC